MRGSFGTISFLQGLNQDFKNAEANIFRYLFLKCERFNVIFHSITNHLCPHFFCHGIFFLHDGLNAYSMLKSGGKKLLNCRIYSFIYFLIFLAFKKNCQISVTHVKKKKSI